MIAPRDHGGGLDAAVARYGGTRAGWLDLSTGINPVPYPVGSLEKGVWTALPDSAAQTRLEEAARRFWSVPGQFGILAAPGASALIARLPELFSGPKSFHIPGPTYNEWRASFEQAGWEAAGKAGDATVRIAVHPNNPDGAFATFDSALGTVRIIDESFCDTCPGRSFLAGPHSSINDAAHKHLVVKSFGKFWGLAGARLGFLIGAPEVLTAMAEKLGPWPVSGPALVIGAQALEDTEWADKTRARLERDAARLDALMAPLGKASPRGTTLFRLYEVEDALALHDRLAQAHIWSRIFPYSKTWIRLGMPGSDQYWERLARALAED